MNNNLKSSGQVDKNHKAVMIYGIYHDRNNMTLHAISPMKEDTPELRRLLCENELGELVDNADIFFNNEVNEYTVEHPDHDYDCPSEYLLTVKTYKELRDESFSKLNEELEDLERSFKYSSY